MENKSWREEVENLINEYRVRCIHGKRMGISSEEFLSSLTKIFEEVVGEDLEFTDSEEGCGCVICNQIQIYNQAKQDIRKRLEEK